MWAVMWEGGSSSSSGDMAAILVVLRVEQGSDVAVVAVERGQQRVGVGCGQ